jgi:hypothetical protein
MNEFKVFQLQYISVREETGTFEGNLKWHLRGWNRRYCRHHKQKENKNKKKTNMAGIFCNNMIWSLPSN